ncbi:MAG: PIN domain-containing protein [bacterium]|nr:PIN domain-containing protein [bacterium]
MGTNKIGNFEKKLLSAKKVGLDSMIFLYQFADHPLYAPLTVKVFQLLEAKKIQAVTSTITIAEVFVRAEEVKDEATIFAYEQVFASLPSLSIIPLDTPLARLAAKIRAQYPKIRLPDAIQISAPLYTQCPLFITNDKKLNITELEMLYLDDWVEE